MKKLEKLSKNEALLELLVYCNSLITARVIHKTFENKPKAFNRYKRILQEEFDNPYFALEFEKYLNSKGLTFPNLEFVRNFQEKRNEIVEKEVKG